MPYLSVVSHDGYCPAYGITKVRNTPGFMVGVVLLAIPVLGSVIGAVFITTDENTGGCCTVESIIAQLEQEAVCK